MTVNLYASLPHYAEHLWPIWQQLSDDVRGESWAPRSTCWWGTPLPHPRSRSGLVLCSSYADAKKLSARHQLIYVEHGAGQSYDGDPAAVGNGSYSGGVGLDTAALFIAPGEHVAERWGAMYPSTPVAVVGCPKLDSWHAGERRELRSERSGPLVAVTFHWDCGLVPETHSALRHHQRALGALRDAVRSSGGELLGHGHPRAWGALRALWASLGVPHTSKLADVLDQADVLVADNTSALYEFASLDRPVVVLNAPWYRREVEHGLRFWTHVPGVQCDEPDQLVSCVQLALADPPELRALRSRAVERAYAHSDGQAASRAAAAIVEVLHAQPQGPAGAANGVAVVDAARHVHRAHHEAGSDRG